MRTSVLMSALLCLAFLPGCGGNGANNTRSLRFTITDLGPAPTTTITINNTAQVAVTLQNSTATHPLAYLIADSHQTALGTLGGPDSYADHVNAQGQVVGSSQVDSGSFHAFLYSNGKMQDLSTLGGAQSNATSINNAGQVVGASQRASGSDHAFLYSNGSLIDLGTLPGDTGSYANAINDSGQIVGTSSVGSTVHAFLYSRGTLQALGTLGGSYTTANAINNNGQIVGNSAVSNKPVSTGANSSTLPYHAFLYSNGKMQDLGTLGGPISGASAINNGGQVVGFSQLPGTPVSQHAILYTGGKLIDLNTTIAGYAAGGSTGWDLTNATGINDAGQIVGYGQLNKQWHAFLLTP